MSATYSDYINYIKTETTKEPIFKIELLRQEDESVYSTLEGKIENNSGALTIALNDGIRRTVNFTIINSDNEFYSYIENLTINSKFALYLGFMINDEPFYIKQGVFLFDDPSITSKLSDRKIEITGSDKWVLWTTNFETTYVIAKLETYGSIIRKMSTLGIINDVKTPLIDPLIENLQIPYAITKTVDNTPADLMLEIALALSCRIYYNTEGQLVVEKIIQDNQKSTLYKFSTSEFNYLGGKKTLKNSEIYNSVIVQGDNVQTGSPIILEVQNNDLTDKNSIPNVGRIKRKIITDYTQGITSIALAQERGVYELRQVSVQNNLIDIDSISMYHLDVDNCVDLEDEYLTNDYDRFLIKNINIPIGSNLNSTLSGYRVNEFNVIY